jgi:hypothetical protein
MLTFHELKERLKKLDEISLMEELDISSEDLVDRFEDYIELKFEKLCSDFDEDEDEEEDF